jgi:hypothetical protein
VAEGNAEPRGKLALGNNLARLEFLEEPSEMILIVGLGRHFVPVTHREALNG